MRTKAQIMEVEDECIVAEDTVRCLKALGYEVPIVAATGSDALAKAEKLRPDIVLMDIILKGEPDGIETAGLLQSRFGIPIIYVTAHANEKTLERAKITKPHGYILKPFGEREIQSVIETALYKYEMEKKYKETEQDYCVIVESCLDGICRVDQLRKLVFVNNAFEHMFGYAKENIIGETISFLYPSRQKKTIGKWIEKVLSGESIKDETTVLHADGHQIPVLMNIVPSTKNGGIDGCTVFLHDISDLKRAEAASQQRESLLRHHAKEMRTLNKLSHQITKNPAPHTIARSAMRLVNTCRASDLALVFSCNDDEMNFRAVYPDKQYTSRIGREVRQVGECLCGLAASSKKPIYSKNIESDRRCTLDECKAAGMRSFAALPLLIGNKILGVMAFASKTEQNFEDQASFLEAMAGEAAVGFQNALLHEALKNHNKELEKEIVERKHAEEKINASLEEKKILVKEIHHRVKNNLQVICSLLNLQARHIEDEKVRALFNESRDRVRSMSLIYDKLLYSKDFTRIYFPDYINALAQNLFRTYHVDEGSIELNVRVDNVAMGVDVAVPCGLIMNELIANSLKHAFPTSLRRKKKKIEIALRSWDKNSIELSVEDNGIGIPQDVDINNSDSLGLALVKIIIVDQLQGEIQLNRDHGTQIIARFRKTL